MDTITMQELKEHSGRHPGWCVSLFMPTHRRGRETEQDPIRFRNLLSEAETRLLDKGLSSPDVRDMLRPASRLQQDDPGFWRRQSDGLAVFLTSEHSYFFRLPIPFEELVVISDRFHLKPLLPFFASDGHFYILALSQNQVRLLEGSRHTVDEIDLEHMSTSMAEALHYEQLEKQLQHRSDTSGGPGGQTAIFHGHDPSDEEKDRILRWFHKIDDEMSSLLTSEQAPLVLAGVEYLFPLYQQASSYPHLLEDGVQGNPEELTPERLHARAWPLVESIFAQAREKAAARYRQLAGTGQTTADVSEAVRAAHHGRVDTLFVAVGTQVWGAFDPSTDTVDVHQGPEPGDEDLLDLAAIQSLLTGAAVYAVEPELVPDHAPLAAVFRY